MSRRRAGALALALFAAALGTTAASADTRRYFDATVSIEFADSTPLALGQVSGLVRVADDGSFVFPPGALQAPGPAAISLVGTGASPVVSIVPSAFAGGTLSTSAVTGGFGGALGVRGIVLIELLADSLSTLPALEIPMAMGSFASDAAPAHSSSPAPGAPPVQVVASLSQSRFTTAATLVTGTQQNFATSQQSVSGARTPTASGGENLSLVAPVALRIASLDSDGVLRSRTLGATTRIQIHVPEPGLLAAQLAAVAALVGMGWGNAHGVFASHSSPKCSTKGS